MSRRRLHYVLLAVSGLVVFAVGYVGCIKSPDDWEGKGGPPRVIVSFPPLYSFVKSVGGDHVGVVSICTTSGPHEYSGDPKDNRLVHHADLYFANGLGLEKDFADKLAGSKANSAGFLIKLGDRLPKDLVKKDEDGKEIDPHVWLGIPQAKLMIETIRDELKRVDAAHGADYDANATKYQAMLDKLHEYGKNAFKDKKDKRFISFHESLNYFADSYGLEIADVIEISPGDPPTPKQLARLVEKMQKDKIRIIAVEPQYPSTGSADVLQRELKSKGVTDVELVEIDPMENVQSADDLGADLYERKVRYDIDNLAKHLK